MRYLDVLQHLPAYGFINGGGVFIWDEYIELDDDTIIFFRDIDRLVIRVKEDVYSLLGTLIYTDVVYYAIIKAGGHTRKFYTEDKRFLNLLVGAYELSKERERY